MSFAGVGTGAGAGITGYYKGKKMRDESTSRDSAMRIQELEDQLRELEQDDRVAAIPETFDQNRHEAGVEAAKRKGQMTDAGYEQNRAERTESGAARGEDTAVAGHPGDLETARNKLPQAERTEAIAVGKQPGLEVDAGNEVNRANRKETRSGQVADQETQRYDDKNAHDTLGTAIEALKESGNPAAIDDWYRESMPNGHEITTTEDPDVPGGFIMTDDTGKVKTVGSMDELVTNLETLRGQIAERIRSPGNLGPSPGMSGPDIDRYGRGIGGYGGRGGTQLERMYPQVVEDLRQKYPDKEDWEIRLKAIQVLKERGGEPDDIFLRKLDGDIMKVFLGMSDIGGKRDKFMKEYWKFRKSFFPEDGDDPKAKGPGSDDETTDDWFE